MQVSCACARDKSKKSDQISIPEWLPDGSIKPQICGFVTSDTAADNRARSPGRKNGIPARSARAIISAVQA